MDKRPDLPRRAAAEAFGAFALVFAGCGAIVTDTVQAGVLGTVGVALTRHFPPREALAYLAAQVLGALAAAALLLAVWPGQPAALGTTLPSVGAGNALVSGELRDLWIYIAAPIAGAAVGALAYQLVRGEHPA